LPFKSLYWLISNSVPDLGSTTTTDSGLPKKDGGWQTAVLKYRMFGVPDLLHPAMFIGALDEERAREVHAGVERIVSELPPSEWEAN
jgi:hypothetical protein